MNLINLPELLLTHEVAELLKVSQITIKRKVEAGELTPIRLNGDRAHSWRFIKKDIQKYIEGLEL